MSSATVKANPLQKWFCSSTISRAWFEHTGAMKMLDLFIQMIHFDTFKKTWTEDPDIQTVFNATF